MKNLLPLFFLFSLSTVAQVPRKMLVEHFTNTRCSICASLNPGFYTNLNSQPAGIRHIAYHPSSPYSSCLFSQQNKPENDARTNYYNVYGSTPRILVNGTLITVNNNYNSPTIFDPFENQTSGLSVQLSQGLTTTNDSIQVRAVIRRVATDATSSLLLYGGMAEDTVFYASPNGESRHYDVFRKAVFGINGTTFTAPAQVGDSIVFTGKAAFSSLWNASRLFAYAVVQQTSNRQLVQSEAVAPGSNLLVTSAKTLVRKEERAFPNPFQDFIQLPAAEGEEIEGRILNLQGKEMFSFLSFSGKRISTATLPAGTYLLETIRKGKTSVQKIVKN